jgi:hypothetical protein
MSIPFSDTVNNLGILQQARSFARVDANQWPTYKVVNSCNNWLDKVAGYAIGADQRFQWDDTNHTKLPEGTTTLTSGQSDYSFLTDEQGNSIVTLTGISVLIGSIYQPLIEIDRSDDAYDPTSFGQNSGVPAYYDKIADNIIRLDVKPSTTTSAGLKFFFQRTPSYFAASDTTKAPGVSPLLHRGFVVAAAYDIALTLGLANLNALGIELQKEEKKMMDYFTRRNNDTDKVMRGKRINYI